MLAGSENDGKLYNCHQNTVLELQGTKETVQLVHRLNGVSILLEALYLVKSAGSFC